MGSLKPGKKIAYERDDKGRIWGRYHGETERWIVGGPDPYFIDNSTFLEFYDMLQAAHYDKTLASMLKHCIEAHKLLKVKQ
jgi:hypothetical protein